MTFSGFVFPLIHFLEFPLSNNQNKTNLMKKLFITVIAFSLYSNVWSQTEKGAILVNASLGYNMSNESRTDETGSSNVDEIKNSGFNISLRGGYFVIDNLAVGLVVADDYYGHSTEFINGKSPVRNKTFTSDNTLSYGIFGRYYQKLGESRVSIFYQLQVLMGSGSAMTELQIPILVERQRLESLLWTTRSSAFT
jgi:hypothetical protein